MAFYSTQNAYSSYTIPKRKSYSSYQINYPSSYPSYNPNNVLTTNYSNNLNNSNYRYVNGYNNYNYSFKQVNTNPTNFYSSNNSHTYINTTTIILPPKTYYSNKTSYPMKMNNYYNNNMNYTNFNKTSYQPSYINGTYSNNANNIIPRTSYNTIKGHNRYLTDNNILELTANSTKSSAYGTFMNPIYYNGTNYNFNNSYVINNNNSSFISQINPQNQVRYNPNLISDLKRSYFNLQKKRYSMESYEPIHPSKKKNLLGNYIYSNSDLVRRYSTSSVPVKGNVQNTPEIDNDIIPIEEVELFPNKNSHYIQRKTINYSKRNGLIVAPPIIKKYYFQKVSINSFTRLPPKIYKLDYSNEYKPLNTVRYNNQKEQYNTIDSYRTDYPYDNNINNNRPGIYPSKLYRINLNKNHEIQPNSFK